MSEVSGVTPWGFLTAFASKRPDKSTDLIKDGGKGRFCKDFLTLSYKSFWVKSLQK